MVRHHWKLSVGLVLVAIGTIIWVLSIEAGSPLATIISALFTAASLAASLWTLFPSKAREREIVVLPKLLCPCILLLDTSATMKGFPIAALNDGLEVFQKEIQQDELTRERLEIAIITFGEGGVQVPQDFVTADQFQAPVLTASGNAPIGRAINLALDMLHDRKALYRKNHIRYYRPLVFMITCSNPSDEWQRAARRLHVEEKRREVVFFAIGATGVSMHILAQISVRKPLTLQGLKFTELILWLEDPTCLS